MENFRQFKKEQSKRYQKSLKHVLNREDTERIVNQPKPRISQHTVILDSNDRDVSLFPSPNEWVVELDNTIKNALAIRLLRTEYSLATSFSSFLINDKRIPIQLFKTINAYVYLNGYNNIQVANKNSALLFSQISAGIEVLPPITNNFLYDPYSYVFNPREEKLNRFHFALVDGKGKKIGIDDPDSIRIILSLAVFTYG